MVLTRAFACALPVVASDIPGYREVTTPETSVTVPPDDTAALTEAIVGLLGDEPRRIAMGEAARALAIGQYAWSDIARRLEDLYERAIAADARRAA
jgi:glycosyltransferase involved in cell wall biosynthesis